MNKPTIRLMLLEEGETTAVNVTVAAEAMIGVRDLCSRAVIAVRAAELSIYRHTVLVRGRSFRDAGYPALKTKTRPGPGNSGGYRRLRCLLFLAVAAPTALAVALDAACMLASAISVICLAMFCMLPKA